MIARATRQFRDSTTLPRRHTSQDPATTSKATQVMPKPKEHKETVTYPPSKRKAPPFKPQRPSKLPRSATTESERSDTTHAVGTTGRAEQPTNRAKTVPQKRAPAKKSSDTTLSKKAALPSLISDTEDDIDGSSDDLPDVSIAAGPSKASREQHNMDDALLDILTDDDDSDTRQTDALPPDIDEDATIPQPLLLRLMHEHFESEGTKIDKHAVAVLQKYLDVFVRETIARAALGKKDDVDEGRASQSDSNWLDRQDLEKVAGSMLLDF